MFTSRPSNLCLICSPILLLGTLYAVFTIAVHSGRQYKIGDLKVRRIDRTFQPTSKEGSSILEELECLETLHQSRKLKPNQI